jgi:hypothetical protein
MDTITLPVEPRKSLYRQESEASFHVANPDSVHAVNVTTEEIEI